MDISGASGAELVVFEDEGGEFCVKGAGDGRERGGEGDVDEAVEGVN